MIFARIKANGMHAVGVFKSSLDAFNTLLLSACNYQIWDSDFEIGFSSKPTSEMNSTDIQDSGAMVEGAVVVL